ncbi:ParB N-terminal domain-containing protein [Aeribacillus sp. FSL K6-2848]|uniref:ParB N-terminal domain-containing protein n=1 Tax=unclassified Aeribacillus TaxID=2640495 RepID=UPI0030CBF332
MAEIKSIKINDLLVNSENPRFESVNSQTEAIKRLVLEQNDKLYRLAKSIVEKGLNPSELPIVIEDFQQDGMYRVLEGNRRITAIKILNNPDLIDFSEFQKMRYKKLRKDFDEKKFEEIRCVVVENESEANHWIKLRHTGENNGVGIVSWDRTQQKRFERNLGLKSPEDQILEFIKKANLVHKEKLKKVKITNIHRLIGDPDVREALGLVLENKVLYTNLPKEEVGKGIKKIFEDILSETIKVTDIYYKDDRIRYIKGLDVSCLPDKSKSRENYVELLSLVNNDISESIQIINDENNTEHEINNNQKELSEDRIVSVPNKDSKNQNEEQKMKVYEKYNESKVVIEEIEETVSSAKKSKHLSITRKKLIPSNFIIHIENIRINYIYRELKEINVDDFPNAVAVLLRVFIELSVEHYMKKNRIEIFPNDSLGNKVKKVTQHLEQNNKLDKNQLKPVRTAVSNPNHFFSINTLHSYVHNEVMVPSSKDLKLIWDTIQNFVESLWN